MQIAPVALSSVAVATRGRFHVVESVKDVIINQIITDSRNYETVHGALFVAFVGRKNDGHSYVGAMYEAGVRSFLVSRMLPEFQGMRDACFIEVEDTLQALQDWAAWHRARFSIPVAGITGSNGKTVVKEWLSFLLGFDHKVVRSPQSYNSQIGVPLSVLQMDTWHDVAVFEAGISRPGEMARLQRIMRPTVGIWTNIGSAHDAFFSEPGQKLREKLRLFASVEKLIFRADDPEISSAIACDPGLHSKKLLSWSFSKTSSVTSSGMAFPSPFTPVPETLQIFEDKIEAEGRCLKASFRGRYHELHIPFSDPASCEDAVHCWLFLLDAGYADMEINTRFKQLPPVKMRMEMKEGVGQSLLLNDAYSSDFNSFCLALDFLCNHNRKKPVCVILSDILQSGLPEEKLYADVSMVLEQKGVQEVLAVGPALIRQRRYFENFQARFYPDTESLLASFKPEEFSGKAVLLKGARVFAFERIDALLQRRVHETVMEVNLSALVHNLNYFRSLLAPETKLMVMGKAFSYGSGSHEIADILEFNHVDYVTVAYADEAVALRNNGIRIPVMCMNPEAEGMETVVRYRVEPAIYNFRMLDTLEAYLSTLPSSAFQKQEERVGIHVGLDTGMHRMGFEQKDLGALLERLAANPRLEVRSVYTHLATADMPEMDAYTQAQLDAYVRMSQVFRQRFPSVLRHCLNTAGIVRFPQYQFEMVRLGIGLYGVGTDAEMQSRLETVSSLKTVISQIRTIPAGDAVGYGRRFIASRETRVGVIGIGYADGLNRHLGNGRYSVWVKGEKAPIIGSICMDMCMIDLTGIPAEEGDEVEVFGSQNPVGLMADVLGTIPYEILTSVSGRVKRLYITE